MKSQDRATSNYEFTWRRLSDARDGPEGVRRCRLLPRRAGLQVLFPHGLVRGHVARQPQQGAVPNKVFPLLEGTPFQLVFTPNSDTPYSGLPLDLSNGPMVVELPPG